MKPIDNARRAFEDIAAAFPGLRAERRQDEQVELGMEFPSQSGLSFDIGLTLQNEDELFLSVGSFRCSWFPCTEPERVEEYKDAVIGLVRGDNRLLEHYRGKRSVKAELQEPRGGSWATIATWSSDLLPFPWRKTYRILRNA